MALPVDATTPGGTVTANGECSGTIEDCPISASVKAQLYDPLYDLMRDNFLRQGPGRRKTLPNLVLVTNKILLQLLSLKLETCSTWDEVLSWFQALFPGFMVSSSAFCHMTRKAASSLWGKEDLTEIQAMLQCVVPLDSEVPARLQDLGLSKRILCGDPNDFNPSEKVVLDNGIMYALNIFRTKVGLPFSFVEKWMQHFIKCNNSNIQFTLAQIKRKCEKIMKMSKDLLKRGKKEEMQTFLAQPLLCQPEKAITITNAPTHAQNHKDNVKELTQKLSQMRKTLETKEEVIKSLSTNIEIFSESNRELKEKLKEFDSVKTQLEIMKKENIKKTVLLNDLKSTRLYKRNHYLRKYLQTKSNELKAVTAKLKELESEHLKEHVLKEDTIEEIKRQNSDSMTKKEDTIAELKKQIKLEQSMKCKYKKQLEEKQSLLNIINDDCDEKEIKLRDKVHNQFSKNVRLTFMALMGEANLAAQNCSKAVQIVSRHLFNKELSLEDLPSESTILNFASEAHHIAQHHVVDKIKKSEHFTLATDGTSRQKKHFLERHIVLDDKCSMSLGFTEIVRDDADTLLEKTVEIFTDLSEIYCLASNTNAKDEIFKEVIRKMKCMMSDRASVMKSFDKKMLGYKKELLGEEESIEFLFCNAHFLLGLVTASEKALLEVEKTLPTLGRDVETVFSGFQNSKELASFRLIRLASEVFGPRGDEKCGCREEWLAYCSLKQTPSKFTSFRTNRFNNLFENASAIIFHHEDIKDFLSNYVSHSNLKFQSILADVKDCQLLSLISSLALFHLNFSAPYWKLMNSETSYGEFPSYVFQMKKALDSWIEVDFDFNNVDPMFEEKFCIEDRKLMDFLSSSKCDNHLVKNAFIEISKQSLAVLERQLDDFLDGGVYNGELSSNTQSLLNSCPLTNLVGERLFGDLDYDMGRRRHSSLHLRTTLNMWKRNRTLRWINEQSKKRSTKLLQEARKHAVVWKKRSKKREREVKVKIRERIVNNMKLQKEKEIKLMEKKTSALDAIINHGCLCSTKEEIDNLVLSADAHTKLKDQLRYRKYVLGESIGCTGSLQILYDRLCTHLGFEASTLPLQRKRRRLN